MEMREVEVAATQSPLCFNLLQLILCGVQLNGGLL